MYTPRMADPCKWSGSVILNTSAVILPKGIGRRARRADFKPFSGKSLSKNLVSPCHLDIPGLSSYGIEDPEKKV